MLFPHHSSQLDSLVECARALGGHANYSQQEQLEAIRQLQAAPPSEVWNRALALSLTDEDKLIRQHGLQACLTRLDTLPSDVQSAFLKTLLDFCFHDLSSETEEARAKVIQQIGKFLHAHPLERQYEQLLSHWLTRVQDIQYMHDQQKFASAVVRGQAEFATGDRADTQVVADLYSERRLRAYKTIGIAESTLLAYLDEDYQLSIEQTFPPKLFAAYSALLQTHAQGHAYEALLAVFRNLTNWLSQLPQDLEERLALVEESARARRGVPWEELHPELRLHLVAHNELLPGASATNDLFVLLKTNFTHPAANEILIAALKTLCYLPTLRTRIPELLEYLRGNGMRTLNINVWLAVFELIESLITGISLVEPTPSAESATQLTPTEARNRRRRIRLRRKMLQDDAQLRQFLYDISTDTRDDGSARYSEEVRQEAWRILLRSLPEERLEHYGEGMKRVDNNVLFVPSLEVAGETHQRETWELLAHSWDEITLGNEDTAGRRERLKLVCELLGTLRSLEFVVRRQNNEPPRLIGLALDDPDPEVRRYATDAIRQAGFSTELEREIQRRRLDWLRQEQTRLNHEVLRLDQELSRLNAEQTECQANRTKVTLQLQSQMQERNWIVTQGHLITTRFTLDLREVQVQIAKALDKAGIHERELHRLAEVIAKPLRELQAARGEIESLVSQQQRWEGKIRNLENRRWRVNRKMKEAKNPLSFALRGAQLISIGQGIKRAQNAIRELDKEIENVAERYRRIESDLSQLQSTFNATRHTLEQIRREINRLTQQADRIRQELKGEHQKQQKRLFQNDQELQQISQELKQVEGQLTNLALAIIQTNDQLQETTTAAQRTVQDIDLGRQHYDQLTAQAQIDNAAAREQGQAEQTNVEELTRESQESLIWYAHNIEQTLRQPQTVRG